MTSLTVPDPSSPAPDPGRTALVLPPRPTDAPPPPVGPVPAFTLPTAAGPLFLAADGGRWVVLFNGHRLGRFAQPADAAAALAGGRLAVPGLPDPAALDFPADLTGWRPVAASPGQPPAAPAPRPT